MPLSPEQRAIFSRHLSLPEIGEVGQERLLGTRVRLPSGAEPFAAEVARVYLVASGVTVVRDLEKAPPAAVLDRARIEARAERPELVATYAALAGTLAALDTMRDLLRIGPEGR